MLDMFRISSRVAKQHLPKRQLRTDQRILFHRAKIGREEGVIAQVRHMALTRSYFYPRAEIERRIEARGGRDGYVYKEGFSLSKTMQMVEGFVRHDVRGWSGALGNSQMVPFERFSITQPGIDMWRMLCFALDQVEETPASFGVNHSLIGRALIAGNHRALYTYSNGASNLRMVWTQLPRDAVNYVASLKSDIEFVSQRFGSSRITALEESFIEQVEAQESAA